MENQEKKILYGAAFARAEGYRMTKGGKRVINWHVTVSYFHASDTTEASFMFRAGNTQELVNFENFKTYKVVRFPMRRVIAIAPSIFVFENQDTGEKTVEDSDLEPSIAV